MLCPNFLSDPVPHRTEAEYAAEVGYRLLTSATYNEDLLAPGEFECLYSINGLFTNTTGGQLEDSGTIILTGWTRQRWWPSWARYRWEFDAETGAYLRRGAAPNSYYARDIYQGAGGELWLQYVTGPLGLLNADYQYAGEALFPEHFGAITFGSPLVDRARDRFITNINSQNTLRIYRLSTREELHTLRMPDTPVDICHQEGSRAYVLTHSRFVFLIDYEAGRFLGATKLGPGAGLWNQNKVRMAWDKRFKRLLFAAEPNPKGFAYSTVVEGFKMHPVHTHLCAPIPLERQRAGRPFRVLIKATGDRGEGLPGLAAVASPALSGPNALALDGHGEGIATFTGAAEGAVQITATLDTPCLP